MSQVTRVRARPHLTLNSDGQKHTLVNALAIFTLVAGVVAFALGFVVARHAIASWIGLATLVVGFYGQMISATREQRIVIVTGLVAAFVGLMLAFAHGGPFPYPERERGPARPRLVARLGFMLRIGAHDREGDPLAVVHTTDADIVQFFLGDPQGWDPPTFPGGDAAALRDALAAAGVDA